MSLLYYDFNGFKSSMSHRSSTDNLLQKDRNTQNYRTVEDEFPCEFQRSWKKEVPDSSEILKRIKKEE